MLSDKLRQGTLEQHKRLENESFLRFLMTDQLTPENYAKILRCFYSFYKAHASAIDKGPHSDLYQSLTAPSIDWLEQDLAALKKTNPEFISYPIADETVINPEREEDIWAFAYVKEGSLLGGQLIVRHLNEKPAFENLPSRYFAGMGSETGVHWRRFKAALNAREDALDHPRLIETANNIFTELRRLFDDKFFYKTS